MKPFKRNRYKKLELCKSWSKSNFCSMAWYKSRSRSWSWSGFWSRSWSKSQLGTKNFLK